MNRCTCVLGPDRDGYNDDCSIHGHHAQRLRDWCRQTQRELIEAEGVVSTWRFQRDECIREARSLGWTLDAIAEALGVTKQRVQQIVAALPVASARGEGQGQAVG